MDENRASAVLSYRVASPQYASPSRGGYQFSFTGEEEGETFSDEYKPAYSRYVYLAWPEPGQTIPYAFALRSETGKIHYTTDGRIPAETDPAVTDRVAADAPEVIKEVGPEDTDDGVATKLKALINRFLRSKTVQDSQLAFHEDRAIKDLRLFATAQQAFQATLGGRGAPPAGGTSGILLRGSYVAQRTMDPIANVELSNSPRRQALVHAAAPMWSRKLSRPSPSTSAIASRRWARTSTACG